MHHDVPHGPHTHKKSASLAWGRAKVDEACQTLKSIQIWLIISSLGGIDDQRIDETAKETDRIWCQSLAEVDALDQLLKESPRKGCHESFMIFHMFDTQVIGVAEEVIPLSQFEHLVEG